MNYSEVLAAGMFGLGSITAASTATWFMTPELYDTHIRSTAHSLAYCVARVGAMCSSYVVDSDGITDAGVGAVLMCVCLCAAGLAFQLRPRSRMTESPRAADE